MGYNLEAYIGSNQGLKQISELFENAQIIDLDQGLKMIPITENLFKEITDSEKWVDGERIDNYDFLTKEIADVGRVNSKFGRIAYLESLFHGGDGGHTGIVWNNQIVEFRGLSGDETANEILKCFGVKPDNSLDEFEAVGLKRQRNTDNWE